MPESALTEEIRQRPETLRKTNSLMATMLPLADMVRSIRNACSREDASSLPAEAVESFEALAEDHGLKKAGRFARMLSSHSFGILTAWKYRISTGPPEGVNTRAKPIKRIGYGYRDFRYFVLKLKAAFPGTGASPLQLLGTWTAVIKGRLCHTDLGREREAPLLRDPAA